MLDITRDSVQFSEREFKAYNPKGYAELGESLEILEQKKALARTAEEKREICMLLDGLEQQRRLSLELAEERFRQARDRAYEEIERVRALTARKRLAGRARQEIENLLEHAVTVYAMKDFTRAGEAAARIARQIRDVGPKVVRFQRPDEVTRLIAVGERLEREGRLREALQVYARVLELRPEEPRVKARLQTITARPANW